MRTRVCSTHHVGLRSEIQARDEPPAHARHAAIDGLRPHRGQPPVSRPQAGSQSVHVIRTRTRFEYSGKYISARRAWAPGIKLDGGIHPRAPFSRTLRANDRTRQWGTRAGERARRTVHDSCRPRGQPRDSLLGAKRRKTYRKRASTRGRTRRCSPAPGSRAPTTPRG